MGHHPGHPPRRNRSTSRRGKSLRCVDRQLGSAAFIEQQIREAGGPGQPRVRDHRDRAHARHRAGKPFARGLATLGCGLALDDFGTGFGSFTYLKKLPITHLKIDIEFVRDPVTNPANLHVVKAIVSLAHAFGLKRSRRASRTKRP